MISKGKKAIVTHPNWHNATVLCVSGWRKPWRAQGKGLAFPLMELRAGRMCYRRDGDERIEGFVLLISTAQSICFQCPLQ